MRYLSHSQISTYEKCPYQWYMGYVLKYPQDPNAAFAEGRVVHAAIASYWLGNRDWEKVLKANIDWEFQNLEVPGEFIGFSKIAEKSDWLGVIENRSIRSIEKLTKRLREEFKCPLETIEVERKWKKNSFVGVIDWRGKANGVEYILDWKTSRKPYNEDKVHTDDQLTAYAALTGIRHVGFGVMPKEYGDVQVLLSARTQDECQAYWEKVERIRKEMDGGSFPCVEGWYCNWCSFQNRCPVKGDF